ncbi:MAG: universal stress protein [Ignavibacteriaceae bacterium]|nr:universal stress protein [Ignavibacteriaceae bacterium]
MNSLFHHILVPIDFSDYSKAALRFSVEVAQHCNAELVLIYVVEPFIYPPDFSMGQIALPAVNLELDKRAEEQLQKLAESEIGGKVKVKTVVKSGTPFVEILDFAKTEDIDLIIISTHGHTGVEHLLFGSTTDKVVRKSPCPVLTLRDPIKGFDYKSLLQKKD